MTCWKSSAKQQFDSWSRGYDRSILQRLFFRPSHDKVLDAARIPPAAKVLDVGCGTGLFARRMVAERPDISVTGLDISDGMLEKARRNCADCPQVRLVKGDSETLPFPDDSFDLVTCVHSFHHYPHQQQVVAEMHRVLRPGGQVIIVDGDRDRWWGWLVFDLVVTTIEGLVHHCSARRFRELYLLAGFETPKAIKGGWLAPFLVVSSTANKPGRRSAVRRAA